MDVVIATGVPSEPTVVPERLPEWATPHRIVVADRVSRGGMGPQFPWTRNVYGFAEDTQKTVKTAAGEEVVSTGEVTVNFDENIPLGSRVTVWPGISGERTAEVIAISRHHAPGWPSYQTISLA